MQEGDVFEHSSGQVCRVLALSGGWCELEVADPGKPPFHAMMPLEDAEEMELRADWTKIPLYPLEQMSGYRISGFTDPFSCTYESPKTPQEEEEDYRKKRDAIFARMLS